MRYVTTKSYVTLPNAVSLYLPLASASDFELGTLFRRVRRLPIYIYIYIYIYHLLTVYRNTNTTY